MPVHLLSGMKGKFVVTEDNATSISSIPGPSPMIQQALPIMLLWRNIN